jgi:hypothetical protein
MGGAKPAYRRVFAYPSRTIARMTVSVRDILGIPGMALRLVAGVRETARPIRWVHVSELEDPTPWW